MRARWRRLENTSASIRKYEEPMPIVIFVIGTVLHWFALSALR